MKASVKFREDQSPLCKAKLPLTVAGLPLVSGLVVGTGQDLALHLGTFFEAGPSCKVAYRPNDSTSPLSLVLKTGLGLWGSPNAAALAMTAEFVLRGNGGPFFAIRVKPRVGDFSLRKRGESFTMKAREPTENGMQTADSCDCGVEERVSVSNRTSSPKIEKSLTFSPLSIGDNQSPLRKGAPFSSLSNSMLVESTGEKLKSSVSDSHAVIGANGDAQSSLHKVNPFLGTSNGVSGEFMVEKLKSSISDSHVVIGSNYSLKIEGLDRERKGRGDRKQKFEGGREQEVDAGMPKADVGTPKTGLGNIGMTTETPKAGLVNISTTGDILEATLQEDSKRQQMIEGEQKHRQQSHAGRRFGFDGGLTGWSANAHSTLPLGKHAKLNIRWGVKLQPDFSQSWSSSISGFSLSKLPFLLLDKLSVESVNPTKKLQQDRRLSETTGSLDYELLPVAFNEESRELAQIAGMCYSMKRQLHLLYAENKLLRRALEEMRAEFEYRGGAGTWKPVRPGELLIQEERVSRPPLLEEPKKNNGREANRRDSDGRKDRRDSSRRDPHVDGNAMTPDKAPSGLESELSEELKKAIMNVTSSPAGGKNE